MRVRCVVTDVTTATTTTTTTTTTILYYTILYYTILLHCYNDGKQDNLLCLNLLIFMLFI
jgi:hypothetical protein